MRAVSTNQIADFLHFNDNVQYTLYSIQLSEGSKNNKKIEIKNAIQE